MANDTNHSLQELLQSSHLDAVNFAWIDSLYEDYLRDPSQVSPNWREFFLKLSSNADSRIDTSHAHYAERFLDISLNKPEQIVAASDDTISFEKKSRVNALINAYREKGHQAANIDPLQLLKRERPASLELDFHRLQASDLEQNFLVNSTFFPEQKQSLQQLVDNLNKCYCGTMGVEYMYITDIEQRQWLQQKLESTYGHPDFDGERKLRIMERLSAGEGLEKSLAAKYPGTKRFGLEGGEALIPQLDELIQRSGSYGMKEIVLGMAHRGRLNVLVNIFGKNPSELFDEFEGKISIDKGSGDVKYHMGFSSNVMTSGGIVHLALAFNPSHLEIVGPVVEGSVRARQDRRRDVKRDQVLPVIIHGDAAIAGQGVVMETLQMAHLHGFSTGGSVHIVINNQIGFTTSLAGDARSTEYCTDVAKLVQAPIFHVNGDDPEAVVFATQLALDFRMQFHKDVVIDLVCYRRLGHNEADEPSVTQPMMYKKIRKHPTTRTLYAQRLTDEGTTSKEATDNMLSSYRAGLEEGKHATRSLTADVDSSLFVDWTPYLGHEWSDYCDTSYPEAKLRELATRLDELNTGVPLHKVVRNTMAERAKMTAGSVLVNWGYAENLAYATLLEEGFFVRLVGQDCGRGTFAHRMAILRNNEDGNRYIPLKNLNDSSAQLFSIYDSYLSEEAVLAFEYGYATTAPNGVVIWEAQFGDFANGAQVVIDQFLTSGENKWQRLCGLTTLLPHGYEGQGPEHSSARLERFLQLAADNNIQVCVPTNSAQIFHMLRRQAIRPLRKPLIALTPKSLLRSPLASVPFSELANGSFQTVIATPAQPKQKAVERIIFCYGKVYYDLEDYRQKHKIDNALIVRIEQLYPFPQQGLLELLAPYRKTQKLVWAQEEPRNQGGWYISQHQLRAVLKELQMTEKLEFAGRPASASPAVGYMKTHKEQQQRLVIAAFSS